jgi:hypothetical protein
MRLKTPVASFLPAIILSGSTDLSIAARSLRGGGSAPDPVPSASRNVVPLQPSRRQRRALAAEISPTPSGENCYNVTSKANLTAVTISCTYIIGLDCSDWLYSLQEGDAIRLGADICPEYFTVGPCGDSWYTGCCR